MQNIQRILAQLETKLQRQLQAAELTKEHMELLRAQLEAEQVPSPLLEETKKKGSGK